MGKKTLSWIPTIIMVIVIFYLTLQSPTETTRLSRTVQKWLSSFYAQGDAPKWIRNSHTLRSIAHIPEFFVLSICLLVGYHFSVNNPVRKTSLTVLMISIIDESIKTLLPRRHVEARDIDFDIVGLIIAVGLYYMCTKACRRKA